MAGVWLGVASNCVATVGDGENDTKDLATVVLEFGETRRREDGSFKL